MRNSLIICEAKDKLEKSEKRRVLSGLTVLNTRPAPQSHKLTCLLESHGAQSVAFPCLTLEAYRSPSLVRYAAQLALAEYAIFLSANAVLYSNAYWPNPFPTQAIAIGPATSQALQQAGLHSIIMPEKFSSAGLIELQALRPESIKAKKVAVFCGKNPKPVVIETLRQHGATVWVMPCYVRKCPNPSAIATEKVSQVDVILCTSHDSLHNLMQLCREKVNMTEQKLVVVSTSLYQQAQVLGWRKVYLASNATTEGLVQTLLSMQNK